MSTWRVIPFDTFSARENMAVDEAVFREVQRTGGPPTLRFYGWNAPAVSIGYFQDAAAEINLTACRERGVTLVRRPTGGRAVYHDDDLTYAVMAPESNPLFPPDIAGTYAAIGRCLVRGLEKLGLAAVLASGEREDQDPGGGRHREAGTGGARGKLMPAPACFSVPSRHELLVAGRKICGSAQMRSRGAFLQQGSLLMGFDPENTAAVLRFRGENPVQQLESLRRRATSVHEHLPHSVTRADVCRSLLAAFQEVWQVAFAVGGLRPEEERLSLYLMETKYGRDDWNLEGHRQQKIAKE